MVYVGEVMNSYLQMNQGVDLELVFIGSVPSGAETVINFGRGQWCSRMNVLVGCIMKFISLSVPVEESSKLGLTHLRGTSSSSRVV